MMDLWARPTAPPKRERKHVRRLALAYKAVTALLSLARACTCKNIMASSVYPEHASTSRWAVLIQYLLQISPGGCNRNQICK